MIKGIYYPNSDILNAGKGSRASWAWSSLLDGKALIVEGARWQVGNGSSIDLWRDSWLTSSKCGYLRPIVPVQAHAPSSVADIIDWRNYCWNTDLIKDLISEDDLMEILRIPLGDEEYIRLLLC